MDDEARAIAERAVACEHWRWTPGMRFTHRWIDSVRVLCGADGEGGTDYVVRPGPDGNEIQCIDECATMGFFPRTESAYPCLPDLTDPATLGCLLALVRGAWGDPGASVWFDRRVGLWCWMADGCMNSVWVPRDEDGYGSEAAALVAALKAAPHSCS